jgi:hypothetical protein
VTYHGYDRDALAMMARAAKDAMAGDAIEAIADKGYYKGEEIVACEQEGIAVTVSKPHTSNAGAQGRFDRADFMYLADDDVYICPAGERLTYRFTNEEAGKTLRSKISVRPRRSVAFGAGSTKPSWSVSRSGSTTTPGRSRCGVRPSSIRSVPSRHGWARPISR